MSNDFEDAATEAGYLAFLREIAEVVDVMLSGVVTTTTGDTTRVDPQKVQDLFRRSVRQFLAWWKWHHRAENKSSLADLDADTVARPNPVDWPTPEGRRAFAGEKQLTCYVATLCAVHDANKNPCAEVRSWVALRGLLHGLIRNRDPQAGYDQSVIREAVRCVSEHLVERCRAKIPLSASWLVDWNETDPNYMPAAEARASLSGGRPTGSTLSKKLGTIPVRYMRKSNRCRVHIIEYRAWARTEYPNDAKCDEIATAFIAATEAEKEAAKHAKQRRQ